MPQSQSNQPYVSKTLLESGASELKPDISRKITLAINHNPIGSIDLNLPMVYAEVTLAKADSSRIPQEILNYFNYPYIWLNGSDLEGSYS